MNTSNRFRRALTKPAKDRPVLDAVATSGEAIVDILMKDELVAAVPVFAAAFKIVKARDSWRDRVFALKLHEFLAEAETMPEAARRVLCRKLLADDEGVKAAETLLLVLDKLSDMDKPRLLGFILKQCGEGRVTTAELRRLTTAVDLAFADDLDTFLSEAPEDSDKNATAPHREGLLASGLTRVLVGDLFSSAMHFGVTPLGELLQALVRNRDPAE